MPPKKQFIYYKKRRKKVKQRKIEFKSNILTENIFFLLEDKSIKSLLVYKKNIPQYKNLD